MQDLRVHSEQVIPLSSQITQLQEIGINLESLEKNVDQFFTVGYIENLEKANTDIDDLFQIILVLKNNPDNNTGAGFVELEDIFSKIHNNINYLANLEKNSTNANEINERRILVYELINKGKQKHREMLSETMDQLNANVIEQERIISERINLLLNLIFVILVTGTVMSIIISRSISRPIEKLKSVAGEIARGNLNTKTGIKSNDEIGQLATAFDNMTETLQKTMVSKDFMETVLNGMKDAISVIDVNDFTIIDVNNFFLDVYGLKKEDVIGKKCHEITHLRAEPCIPPNDICPLMDTVKTGKYSMAEHVHYNKNGEKRYVEISTSPLTDETGKVVQLVHVARDITERKQAQEALVQSEEKHRMLIENIQDGVFIIQDGVLQFVNEALARIIGYTVDEVTGRDFREFIAPEDVEMVADRYQRKQAGENTEREYEFRMLHKDRKTRIIVKINVGLIDYRGRVASMGTIKDITDLKRTEEMRIENQHLAYASRAKSEFLANMSHELRTPLNSIIGFSELIKMNSSLDEKSKHQLDNVLTSGKHLLNIINDILDITKVEAGKMELVLEKINVLSFIDDILNLIKVKASKKNLILKKELDPGLSYIEADQQRLKQIIFNLLSNAMKFSKPEGGTITITAKKEDDMAKFSVSDTGIGIREEDMEKLFSTFEQLDSGITKKYGGTGLGLAITKKLVELHGGRITAKSRYGEGTTFSFTLPLEAKRGNDQIKK